MRSRVFAIALALLVPACAQTLAYLPTVIATVQDGIMVLDTIERFWRVWQARHPNQTTVPADKVDLALEKSRTSLNLALRAAQGTDKLNQAQVDQAFEEFKAAYTELVALVSNIGVKSGGDKLQAGPGTLTVPEPLALKRK